MVSSALMESTTSISIMEWCRSIFTTLLVASQRSRTGKVPHIPFVVCYGEVMILILSSLPVYLDVDCSSTEVFNESTCKDCKTASFQATQAIVIGFISQFPQIFTDLCRSKGTTVTNVTLLYCMIFTLS